MSFTEVLYEEAETFQRTDLTPYRTVFDGLKPNIQGTVVVPTGDIYPDGTTNAGRGKIELSHERGFRAVASERNVGLRVGHTQMPDGKTRLRLMVGPKREFSPETLKKRQAALAAARTKRAAEKAAAEKAEAAKKAATAEQLKANVAKAGITPVAAAPKA